MTDNANNPTPTGERKMLRWILVLQIVILAWLAKNHFDGTFGRRTHNPPAVATLTDTPPSLEPSAPNAPSSFFPLPRLSILPSSPPAQRFWHPASRMRDEMERMMADAHRAFADFDSFFDADAAWATLPASPAMNLREMDDFYELALALPDTDPKSLDVRLDGRMLSVSSRQNTQTAHSASAQSFDSRILLPGPVAPGGSLQVTNENNRICIRIPKPAAATAFRNPRQE
jgi:HSP20 family molecular chaperone IbpA